MATRSKRDAPNIPLLHILRHLKEFLFLFEVADFDFSISNYLTAGMIFLSEEDVDVQALLSAWVNKQEESLR
jgi:hypothetical protein